MDTVKWPRAEWWNQFEIGPGGCWIWTGRIDKYGYGWATTYVNGQRLIHRVTYSLLVGPIPEGLHLDHLCRVKACGNPSHLEPVTREENLRRGLRPGLRRPSCVE